MTTWQERCSSWWRDDVCDLRLRFRISITRHSEAEVHIAGPTPGNAQHHSALLLRKCQNSQLLSWQSVLLVGRCGVASRSAMQLNSAGRAGRFSSPESFPHPGYACCARDRKVCAYAHPKAENLHGYRVVRTQSDISRLFGASKMCEFSRNRPLQQNPVLDQRVGRCLFG
jgi:hypothetical protein